MHRLKKNTVSSVVFQIASILCGFILPGLFMRRYGSEVNGLVNSITQFLGVISFLDLGVGAVVQSSLYKPLADGDHLQVSRVVASANKFFRRLAFLFLFYVIVLLGIYPLIVTRKFDFFYTATLIAAMSISSFAQYYFGIVNSLLLNADQKGYLQYNTQTVTLLLNTIVCVIMISLGCSIQLVKLSTSLIYLARPMVLYFYVNRNYQIDSKIIYSGEPIQQKWNGVAQHIAAVVLDGTDTIVLTIFSTLSNVSIYSVYFLVVKSIKTLFLSLTNGIQALIGELWAKQENERLAEFFGWVEWAIHTGTTYIFTCTAILIVPFIQVYTEGIQDADYVQPAFAFLLTLANAMHCLRLPYNIMVLAAGHYKQTQRNYIVAAVMNIVVSVLTVKAWGLIGVAIGTLAAMAYQTIWLAVYNSRHFIQWSMKKVLKQFAIDGISMVLAVAIARFLPFSSVNYMGWILLSVETALISGIIFFAVNLVFYRKRVLQLVSRIKKKSF